MQLLKSDFHIHTFEDPYDVIEWNAKRIVDEAHRQNFKVLAVTNHQSVYYPRELVEYAKDRGILLIPACEAQICNKHVIILNAGPKSLECRNFDDLRTEKRKGRPIAIMAPHPFYPSSVAVSEYFYRYIDVFDAMEWGSYYFNRLNFNVFAARVAKKFGKPLLGCSDTHFPEQFGNTYSLVDAEWSVESVIDSIINGKCRVITKPLKLNAIALKLAIRGLGIPERLDYLNRNGADS